MSDGGSGGVVAQVLRWWGGEAARDQLVLLEGT